MKTITLTEQAYERIAALKTSPKDSFSKVILRAVPKRGTAAQMLKDARKLPPLTPKQAKLMEAAVAAQRDPKRWRDPWKTA
ncbi:MAG TPA: antitoxin VapB family protein [Rhodanobacteraceae bacterium]|jgi:predicted CopG family antitoxin|nr:antitoxin VapB family protein [Rhodanobacteraceae bacterium]